MLLDVGINAFAVELLVESYFGRNKVARDHILKDGKLEFCFRSHKTPLLKVTLEPVAEQEELNAKTVLQYPPDGVPAQGDAKVAEQGADNGD